MTNATPVLYWIPEHNLKALGEKLDKINRKAEKLGAFAIQYKDTGAVKVEEVSTGKQDDQGHDIKRKILLHQIEVSGVAPKLNGWTFIATLEHANELGNVLRIVPGYEGQLPEKFRNASAENCDHCQTRRQRNDTYVLNHDENGRWAQVGSTCLKDFLGYNDPHGAARFCEYLFQVGEACLSASQGGWSGGSGEYVDDLATFLAYCHAQVRHYGFYVSKKKRREAEEMGRSCPPATADRALSVLHHSVPSRYIETWEHPEQQDFDYAVKVADWCVALKDRDPATLNDFMHNLKVATATGYVGGRKAAIAGAALPVYRREVEKIEPQGSTMTRNPELDSKHFGAAGERLSLAVTLKKVFTFDGAFGTTYLHRFITRDGNVAIWFSSKPTNMVEGQEYGIKGTVKRHDVREKINQTILTRVVPLKDSARNPREKDK